MPKFGVPRSLAAASSAVRVPRSDSAVTMATQSPKNTLPVASRETVRY
jgi:hypothetical protein